MVLCIHCCLAIDNMHICQVRSSEHLFIESPHNPHRSEPRYFFLFQLVTFKIALD